jgi:hypothetical protein
MTAWLDENCGSDGWAMTPSGMRGVLNDAVSIYFLDATLASDRAGAFFSYAHAREGKASKSASFARVAISLITLTH